MEKSKILMERLISDLISSNHMKEKTKTRPKDNIQSEFNDEIKYSNLMRAIDVIQDQKKMAKNKIAPIAPIDPNKSIMHIDIFLILAFFLVSLIFFSMWIPSIGHILLTILSALSIVAYLIKIISKYSSNKYKEWRGTEEIKTPANDKKELNEMTKKERALLLEEKGVSLNILFQSKYSLNAAIYNHIKYEANKDCQIKEVCESDAKNLINEINDYMGVTDKVYYYSNICNFFETLMDKDLATRGYMNDEQVKEIKNLREWIKSKIDSYISKARLISEKDKNSLNQLYQQILGK